MIAAFTRSSEFSSALAARVSIAFSGATLVLLASLHLLSPEFDPSWRVVSEYANGHYSPVLSALFACWAIGTWALAFALSPHLKTRAGRAGFLLLIVAGAGEALAAIFNINHPLHGLAGLLGAGGLPVAAMCISITLRGPRLLLLTANFTWAAVVATIAGIAVLFLTFTHSGGRVPADGSSLPLGTVLPAGTLAFAGYANRLMVVANCVWAIVAACTLLPQAARVSNRSKLR